MPLEDFIITVFCLVDDYVEKLTKNISLRKRGFPPKLSDAEVITMEVVGEFLGIDTDKGIWSYFKSHWLPLFPELGSRSVFAKQAANLWKIKQEIQSLLAQELGGTTDTLHLADGFPMPICQFKRAHFSRIFKGEASFGYCASKEELYYGFKGNVAISSSGIITGITAAPAHFDERESLWEIVKNLKDGLLFADKGLIGKDYQAAIYQETGLRLETPLRNNMTDKRGKDASKWLTSTRRLVETVIGQLTEQFHIEKVRARDLWHLTNRVTRKILSHTVGFLINKGLGNKPLQLEKLITA